MRRSFQSFPYHTCVIPSVEEWSTLFIVDAFGGSQGSRFQINLSQKTMSENAFLLIITPSLNNSVSAFLRKPKPSSTILGAMIIEKVISCLM